MKTYEALKAYHRAERAGWQNESLSLRVHRALSWLQRAEQVDQDPDSHFIFLWISFNAVYANETPKTYEISESEMFNRFLEKLCELDQDRALNELIWTRYSGAIRVLLENRFVFGPFWAHQSGSISVEEFETRFRRHKTAAHAALAGNTPKLLSNLFSNLYTLRNQLLHGGSTWNSGVNREQVRVGAQILGDLVPVIIEIMMRNPATLWGEPKYPVVKS